MAEARSGPDHGPETRAMAANCFDHLVISRPQCRRDAMCSQGESVMRKLSPPLVIIGAALALSICSTPSYAQATRTWVSGVGDDANPCSRVAPCKTFAGAISKTTAAGEINCIDPGGYGAVTITKSIRIISDHIEAGVLVSGTNGIVVNVASTDHVLLD